MLGGRLNFGGKSSSENEKHQSAPISGAPAAAFKPSAQTTHSKDIELSIGHQDELPIFTQKLYDAVALQPSLRHRICPIEIGQDRSGRASFAIVLLKDEVRSDIAEEVIKILALSYVKATPFYYVATEQVMVKLARDAITDNHKKLVVKNAAVGLGKKESSALWALFESAVVFAMKNDASDLHFEVDQWSPLSQIRFRVDGRMTSPREFQLNTLEMLDSLAYLYNVHSKSGSENMYNSNKAQQCHFNAEIKGRKVLFRWGSHQTARGTKVVMRMLYQDTEQSIRSLQQLGYLDSQVDTWNRSIARLGGATIISGVVGSGKSTTMQTVMSMLPIWMAKYTVEDPVEYLMPNTDQFPVSRTMDEQDGDPFLAAKRQLKRMDPDVVLTGEIRDFESAGLFRDIAESGHRAFATLHAPSAIDMITMRLVSSELGIPRDVIATPNFLNLLVYQALVPVLCSECNLPAIEVHEAKYLAQIERLFHIDSGSIRAKNADGCPNCRRDGIPELNGNKGRMVVAEMIEPDSNMLLLFREQKNIELKSYIRGTRTSSFDEPETTGKSALEVAMYHVSRGTMDPRDVELKFGSFDQYEKECIFESSAASKEKIAGKRRTPVRRPLPKSFSRNGSLAPLKMVR